MIACRSCTRPGRLGLLLAGTVLLAAHPAAAQRYVAFGDSITDGVGDSESIPEEERGYTPRLQSMLRNAGQPDAVVVDRGVGAERTPEGLVRIDQVLAEEAGDVLLLMEGSNDISRFIPRATTLFNLEQMALRAESAGYEVVHATLIPRIPNARVDGDNIFNQIVNQYIRDLAGSNGRDLVDNFYGFGIVPDRFATHYWDDPIDGVGHPNATGYDLMAELFFEVLTGIDAVPPVPGLLDPNNGRTDIPASTAIRVEVWDFGSNINFSSLALAVDGEPVEVQVAGSGRRATLIHTPTQPFSGVVTVELSAADTASPVNSFSGEISRFVIAGTGFLPGDADQDGRVDGADLVRLARAFGASLGSPRFDEDADFDGNGSIDGNDLALLAANFGDSSF